MESGAGIGGRRASSSYPQYSSPQLRHFLHVSVIVGMIDLRLNALRLTWDGSMRVHHELNFYLTFERLTLPNE